MLKVIPSENYKDQHTIENPAPELDAWRETYVHFSGHFGAHGPHVFAAAPELLEALDAALIAMDRDNIPLGAHDYEVFTAGMRAAIAKARGEA